MIQWSSDNPKITVAPNRKEASLVLDSVIRSKDTLKQDNNFRHTADGNNPAPVGIWLIPQPVPFFPRFHSHLSLTNCIFSQTTKSSSSNTGACHGEPLIVILVKSTSIRYMYITHIYIYILHMYIHMYMSIELYIYIITIHIYHGATTSLFWDSS